MEIEKLKNIVENAKDKSNKDLFDAENFLFKQHEDCEQSHNDNTGFE